MMDVKKLRENLEGWGSTSTIENMGDAYEEFERCADHIEQLQSDNEKLKMAHWADLNDARKILNSRIHDLTALAEDFRLRELEIKKTLKP